RTRRRRVAAVKSTARQHTHAILLTFEFTANAFLLHMVRNFVGTLVGVGSGELAPADAATILAKRDRRAAGVTAPPEGLALVEVLYPAQLGLPRYDDGPC